jgi:signal peptidase I
MNAPEAVAVAGAALLRRLRRHAGNVVFFTVAVVLALALWPTSLGGRATLTIVSGHSMEPTYYTGDLVISWSGNYEVGDIVVYNPPNVGAARVIHRIIGGDAESGWVMKGDNNDFRDPWRPTNDRILGKASIHIPKVGLIGSVLVSPITWVSLLLIALALIVWPAKRGSGDSLPAAEDGDAAQDGGTTEGSADGPLADEIFAGALPAGVPSPNGPPPDGPPADRDVPVSVGGSVPVDVGTVAGRVPPRHARAPR